MKTSLPGDEADPDDRARQLVNARETFTYDYDALTPLAMAAAIPDEATPTIEWRALLAKVFAQVASNGAHVNLLMGAAATPPDRDEVHDDVEHHVRPLDRVVTHIKEVILTGDVTRRGATVRDFTTLFQVYDDPPIAQSYLDDAVFARMRVAGANPLQIQRVAALDARFPVTDAMFRSVMGERDSLAAAGAEGRLYLADYVALDGLPGGTYPVAQKYVCAPLALFALPAGRWSRRGLVPVAIQLGQRPGDDTPIFTPSDGLGWKIAKSLVQTADGNVHQAVHHLGQTHLVLEPIAMATYRQLATAHPVAALLRPHIEGTLYINDSAVKNLLCPEGGVDAVLAGEIHAVQAAASKSARAWVFNESMLPDALRRRGVEDVELLGDYPYRDDALLVWEAIHDWVAAYLALYYASDADVFGDVELQGWIDEIVSRDGGRMTDIGQGGRIETLAYLTDALALIVFTASAQHAAVNFPQDPLQSYALLAPLAAYAPPPRSKQGITEKDYWDLQPPLGLAHYQLLLGKWLGGVQCTLLGRYPERWSAIARASGIVFGRDFTGFTDPRVEGALMNFRGRLDEIERTIRERNASRVPYEFLLPSRIPQSINI